MEHRQESVRERAYQIWEREGCPTGRQHEHWMRAERELGSETDEASDAAAADEMPAEEKSASKPAKRKRAAAAPKAAAKAPRASKAKAKQTA